MDATAYSAAPLRQSLPVVWPLFRRALATALIALLLFAALFLFARRWAGALNEPLSALALIGVGLVVVLLATSAQWFHQGSNDSGASAPAYRHWLLFLSPPLMAMAISLPGSSLFGLLVLWLLVIAEETWLWRSRPNQQSDNLALLPRPAVAPKTILHDELQESNKSSATPDWLDPLLAQRLTYRRNSEGLTVVEGWARATFTSDQRTIIVHVAFCPAFIRAPQVEAEPLDGPACEIRAPLVLPWGIRWEIKLDTPARETGTLVLGFFAAETPAPTPTPLRS